MGDVIQLIDKYRHEVKPTPVEARVVKGAERPLYLPLPLETWTPAQKVAWLLGVVRMVSGLEVRVWRHSAHSKLYRIQFAHLQPVSGLSAERAWDILGGFHEAAQLLKDGT